MDSINYPTVKGTLSTGEPVTVQVGDYASGRTNAGRLVSGRVIATHPYYPSVVIDGVEFRESEAFPIRASVLVRDLFTVEPQSVAASA